LDADTVGILVVARVRRVLVKVVIAVEEANNVDLAIWQLWYTVHVLCITWEQESGQGDVQEVPGHGIHR